MRVHYSSKNNNWETPQDFFDMLNREHAFTLDVCASPETAKCKKYFTAEDDGLKQKWKGRCYLNPPFGREIGKWLKKAYESALEGTLVVCLVPARTDTRWWQSYAAKGEVWFVPGRLKFVGAKHSAPFPSAVVVFRPSVLTYKKNTRVV